MHDRVAITVRFHAATFSSAGGERRRRPARGDRRLTEWGNLLGDAFETAIIGNLYPRSQIEIYVEVLNADGSVLAAAINATTLALINAGIPLYDYVMATSVGFLAKTALLDVNRMEEAGTANPTLTLATYGRHPEHILLMTADARVGADGLECMTEMAKMGIKTIFDWLDESVVRPATSTLVATRAASGKSEIKG